MLWVFTIILFPGWCDAQQAPNAQALIAGNLNYMRGKTVYLIRSIPRPDTAVVWGMLTFKIREDLIPLEEIFYDEDLQPVKILTFSRI